MGAGISHFSEQDPWVVADGPVASVLILLGRRSDDETSVVLIKRSQSVESHRGEVGFPGGYREATDANLRQTAFRETFEEIGVGAADITLKGSLQPVTTRGGVTIYPWIGEIKLPYPFVLNGSEVDRIILIPLQYLVRHGLETVEVEIQGRTVTSVGIEWQGDVIWGATARLLDQLLSDESLWR